MFELIFGLAFLLSISDPFTRYEYGIDSDLPPACRKVSEEQIVEERGEGKGKAARWLTSNDYICERTIFEYGDRDSFYDFVTLHAAPRARHIALQLKKITEKQTIWGIRIVSDDEDVKAFLIDLYRYELTNILGYGHVKRQDYAEDRGPLLVVTVRRVQDADILFAADAYKEGDSWAL